MEYMIASGREMLLLLVTDRDEKGKEHRLAGDLGHSEKEEKTS